ncbi:MAG: hypothetical protein H0V70_05090 [Ktedonobacteraceae bacterium]|nr:hypothetical protein [Ktedonobacteraceae bacterium]
MRVRKEKKRLLRQFIVFRILRRVLRRIGRILTWPIRRFVIAPVLRRARDLEPEAPDPKQEAKRRRSLFGTWGWMPLLALVSALGLLLIAYGFSLSRNAGPGKLRFFFYPGILMLFTPMVARLITPYVSRIERVILLCITGVGCYCIRALTSPLHFYLYDEFLHWRTENDVIASSHLFTPNSLLPVSPYYPGLEIVTNAVCMLSGISPFYASLILIGVARLTMTLTLFAMNEELFHSSRTGSITAAIYMVNPHFLFFDTQYAYESLALPLALVIFCIMTPYQAMSIEVRRLRAVTSSSLLLVGSAAMNVMENYRNMKRDRRSTVIMAVVVLAALTCTHHATDFFFIALLGIWSVLYRWLRLSSKLRAHLTWLTVLGLVLAVAWAESPNNTVVPYLLGFLSTVFSHPGKHFAGAASTANYAPLTWEKDLAQYGTYFTLVIILFGLVCLWQRYRSHALACQFGLVALGLHASQVLKTSDSGIQLADRASAVLYVAVSAALAVFIVQFWPTRQLHWYHVLIITVTITLLFMGGYISSGGSGYGAPPSPYVVGADSRSIDIESIQAATWTHQYLGSNNHMGTDRTNQLLMATFGNQRIIDTIADHIDVSTIFFDAALTPTDYELIGRGQLTYLVVDLRLTTSPPAVGSYFEKGEPGAMMHKKPVSRDVMMKFDEMDGVNKIFDGGDMIVFDIRGLLHAHKHPKKS